MTDRTEYQRNYKRKKREDPEFLEKAAAIQRKYYKNDPDKKEKAFAYRLKTRYGITVEQYNGLLEAQNNCCALCERSTTTFKNRLNVDHNHASGEIRSLLCWHCNRHIIGKQLDPEIFRKAADYLEKAHTGWHVPSTKSKKRSRKRKAGTARGTGKSSSSGGGTTRKRNTSRGKS